MHNLFSPPSFDWAKLNGVPVRFNCRDEGLQLLANPVMVEDIAFYNLPPNTDTTTKNNNNNNQVVTFSVDASRIEENQNALVKEFQMGRLEKEEAEQMAYDTARSVSGIAFWPRLILQDASDTEDKKMPIEVNSRQFGTGGHQKSHWQTVLPIMSDRPVGGLVAGDKIQASFDFVAPDSVASTSKYTVRGKVFKSNTNSS
uniref:Uncharacterized protein n=1 Tax=Eucampia antarctica TaxID=49252 RepID=A0A7S2RYP8_9STRA